VQLRPRLVVSYVAVGAVPPTRTPTSTPAPTPTGASPVVPTPTAAPPNTEATVILQFGNNGYTRSEDTQIYIYEPTTNYCALDLFKVGERRRFAALIRFDVSAIPASAAVIRASLSLYAVGWGGTEIPIEAFRVLQPVSLCESTWNQAKSGAPWGTVGCDNTSTDREAVALSSIMTSGLAKWHTFDLTNVIQGWIDLTVPNYGVVIQQGWPTVNSGYYFASAQYANPALRPKLQITYRTR